MTDTIVMVFIRNPELGHVKTRLAKTIGDQSALKIYKFLLQHTQNELFDLNCDKAVYYSENINKNDIWDNAHYQKYIQLGSDLGDRMLHAFKNSFESGYKKVLIIGSDLFDLKSEYIKNAIAHLDHYDIVLGPAKDGGYYLLGMTVLNDRIFSNKAWGTEAVFESTMNDLKNESVFLLPELNDIDIYDDIKEHKILTELIKHHDQDH
ncbi:MAG: TIGR04282 family arsenosugar biosynthesis glycosyltransferase [Bacteroidia bacterium]|nr:TIGR04282 family arsenosugar biosynthesis glycosyltransferase [Bacteroidia bacterium]NND25384.1 glycosyltransferase [Flavobacteriaceae bacterium]MBT8279568.1 TIGR04282 family arsenosugar biosynthesis glycosyltransferase [Bacteroidia bacterium]NNK60279.1 glycosyltransferase [Flavobacteriaceae bacterium]NNL34087.1 glycosyltransferase [Flavobacteriaceae bacterium]